MIAAALVTPAPVLTLGGGTRRPVADVAPGDASSARGPTASGALPSSSANAADTARATGLRRKLYGVVVLAPDMTPVPEVRVLTGAAEAVSDERGQFELLHDARASVDDTFAPHVSVPRACWLARTPTLDELTNDRGRAPEVVLDVEVGPTYVLRFELPEGLALHQLGARLFDDEELMTADLAELQFTPLRAGELPWVRFEPAWWIEPPAWLVVRSDGGGWIGKARVAALVGRQATPVEVELERRVRVYGRVLDADGEPAAGANVRLDVADAVGATRSTRAGGNGAFVLRGVPPGACTLQARHERDGEVELALLVNAASPPEPELRLEPYVIGGDVADVVRSTSGRFDGFVSLTLEPLDPDRELLMRSATIEWREQLGALVGAFRFEAVAVGRYRVRVQTPFAPYRCEPEELALGPPAPGLEVLVRDEVRAWRIHPIVWSTEAGYLPTARITARVRGGLVHDGPANEWPRLRRIRADEGLEWTVSAPGHRPASGTLDDLDPDVDSALRRLRVQLEPEE